MSVNRVTKVLGQPFRVERPQDTWIRCFLPYLDGTGAIYLDNTECELTNLPFKFPCKSYIRHQVMPKIVFQGKNICPTFQSLMPKIPPVNILVLKN